jgi:hypothetical protein
MNPANKKLCQLLMAFWYCLGTLNMANAWWNTGHMLVARIAQDILQEESPETLKKAETILRSSDFQTYLHLEDEYPFVECATFADEIKGSGFSDQAHWHFVDSPLIDEAIKQEFQMPDPVPFNVTWAIEQMIDSLKEADAYHRNKPPVKFALAQSFNLRLLIHYVGDIHQPLHTVSRFSQDFLNGDEGGNLFKIDGLSKEHIRNLHMLWDSVVTEFDGDLT